MRDVDVFLFDEPLSNLDAKLRTELRVELKHLHQRLGKATMIYVTHDQIEALTLADRIAVMHAGVIQQLDTPHKIYHRPVNRFVAGFVGSPTMNFRTGRIADCRRPGVRVEGHPTCRCPAIAWLNGSMPGRRWSSASAPSTSPSAAIRRTGTRRKSSWSSRWAPETIVWCRLAGQPLSVRVDGESTIAAGERLPVAFPTERLNLFDAEDRRRVSSQEQPL